MNEVTLHDDLRTQRLRRQDCAAPTGCHGWGRRACGIDSLRRGYARGGRYVQGGGCATDTGVRRPRCRAAALEVIQKDIGTAAAGLLEAEIVTADGVVCERSMRAQIPDLFWAIKGGGGGADWGVVTKADALRTHDLPLLGGAYGRIGKRVRMVCLPQADCASSSHSMPTVFSIPIGASRSISGQTTCSKISMACQGLDAQQAGETWQPFIDWVRASPDDFSIAGRINVSGEKEDRDMWNAETNKSNGAGDDARGRAQASRLVARRSRSRCGRISARIRFPVASGVALCSRTQQSTAGSMRCSPAACVQEGRITHQ